MYSYFFSFCKRYFEPTVANHVSFSSVDFSAWGQKNRQTGIKFVVTTITTGLYYLQIIPIRQRWERRGRQCLIPVHHRRDVVLKRQVAAAAAPAERLNGHTQILLEADRIHNMPAIH